MEKEALDGNLNDQHSREKEALKVEMISQCEDEKYAQKYEMNDKNQEANRLLNEELVAQCQREKDSLRA